MINKYIKSSRISEHQTRSILKCFSLDFEATKIVSLTGVSRQTINRILLALRERIAYLCEQESVFEKGSVEFDESYFGAKRVRGKRGRGARGKHIVFGLIKRGGNVYTQVVSNCSVSELYPIIASKVSPDSTVYTDGFKTYDGLVDYGYQKHYRVQPGNNEFANGHNHINGIENFWGWAKMRLTKFRGISKKTFYLHLKECEFRFNHRSEDLYKILLKELRKSPLKLS